MRQLLRYICMVGLLALAGVVAPAHAVEPDEILKDAALEQRARRLSAELRCMVCQNQSIDDSSAPLARDLRLLVRERLQSGASDDEVRAFLVARYGEFVLLKPPLSTGTVLLWLTPLLVLAGIGILIAQRLRQTRTLALSTVPALNADEQRRLEAILARDDAKR
ncbi:MAG: cytochrome c-type biogenesis protein [Hyphomicrobiaceae bacterium]